MPFPRHTLAEADALVSAAGFESTSVDAAERCIDCRRMTRRTIVGGPFYCSAPAHVRRAIEVARIGQRIMTDRAAELDAMPTDDEPETTEAPAASVLDDLNPRDRGYLVALAAARAAGLYLVATDGGLVGMYPTPEEADRLAETYRADGTGASVIRPCSHTWDRYAPAVECPECGSLRSLESLEAIGGRLNPASRAKLDAHRQTVARLEAIDAENATRLAERETAVAPAPAAAAPVEVLPSIPGEAEVAASRQGLEPTPAPAPAEVTVPPVQERLKLGPVAELELLVRVAPHLAAPPEATRAARHVAACLRGAVRGTLHVIGYTEGGVPEVRYRERRGAGTVNAHATGAYEELEEAGYLAYDGGQVIVTERGHRLLEELPELRPIDGDGVALLTDLR